MSFSMLVRQCQSWWSARQHQRRADGWSLQYRSGTTDQIKCSCTDPTPAELDKANYLRAETITSANARLVDFQATLPLAQIWGGGEVASADGMRFVTPVRTINTGPNRKYFGNNRGITGTTLCPISIPAFMASLYRGRWGTLSLCWKVFWNRRPGWINRNYDRYSRCQRTCLWLFWLLGYQFSPRPGWCRCFGFLANGPWCRLWRAEWYCQRAIRSPKNSLQWDEMIRTAGSLKLGKVQVSVLVRSLLKSERPSGLTQAIIEVGASTKRCICLIILMMRLPPAHSDPA